MSRWRDGLTPGQAAKKLGVHPNTVYTWCQKAMDGEETPLKEVKKNPYNGYYRVKVDLLSGGNNK